MSPKIIVVLVIFGWCGCYHDPRNNVFVDLTLIFGHMLWWTKLCQSSESW